MNPSSPTAQRVAIIGGGYAGCAAAVELARAGIPVSLFEAGAELGGRARRVRLPGEDSEAVCVDNGQHLFIGAYRELLRLIALVGLREEDVFTRMPLDLDMYQEFRLSCQRLPSPLHALAGLLNASGLNLSERWAAIRLMLRAQLNGFRLASDTTVAQWLATNSQPQRLITLLWEPLTLSALNTPIASASAQVLLNVLRDSLAAERAASDFLIARGDLSASFPDAAATYIERHGGLVQRGSLVKKLQRHGDDWRLDGGETHYQAVILALSAHRVTTLADGLPTLSAHLAPLASWTYQPIYTVYLRYPAGTRLPKPMLGFVGKTSHWVFDRGALMGDDGLFAVVISAEGRHTSLSHTELAQRVGKELSSVFPFLPKPIWQKVIAEKRATFACTPGLRRPGNDTGEAGLWLAGDYTAGDYPATLEGAARSGVAAAKSVVASLS